MQYNSSNHNKSPVVKGVSYFLAHVPSLIRYGSKPYREIQKDSRLLPSVLNHLSTFKFAVEYPPNQVFIGNLDPDDLVNTFTQPWYKNLAQGCSRWGPFGEIMPEEEFYGILKICDEFNLVQLDERFTLDIQSRLKDHRMIRPEELAKLGNGVQMANISTEFDGEQAIPLYNEGDRLIGYFQRPVGDGAEEDPNLVPHILLENLASKATGVMALRNLLEKLGAPRELDYLIGCGEEAVGDRYNRGGGNMAKAIGELCGCYSATGSDVKAFCCAPVHGIVLAAGLVNSGIFRNVAVVAGGSLAKLGMKFQGHLHKDMPILEDVLAGVAIWVSQNDNKSPIICLDAIGKHEIGSGSAQQAIIDKLVVQPLDKLGLRITDINKYATEMHNPELTEPQGSGNVPRTNYRTIGSFAVIRKEINKQDLEHFVEVHGMPGFSPTQGHIASAIPVLGHSVRKMLNNDIENTMFLAKGSLFLGRMTRLSDGMSFILQKNSVGE
ncbi:glycine/sarcosine/betaine reductase complex component C subunit beta [Chloroflexota bacterium]